MTGATQTHLTDTVGPFTINTWSQPGRRWNRQILSHDPHTSYGYNLARDGHYLWTSKARYGSHEGALKAGRKDAQASMDWDAQAEPERNWTDEDVAEGNALLESM